MRQLVHRARLTLRAAATVLVPMPLAEWAAAAGTSGAGPPTAERIAELVAGAGAGAFVTKAATVGVIATTAVAGPAIVTSRPDPPPPTRERAPDADAHAARPRGRARDAAASAGRVDARAAPRDALR